MITIPSVIASLLILLGLAGTIAVIGFIVMLTFPALW